MRVRACPSPVDDICDPSVLAGPLQASQEAAEILATNRLPGTNVEAGASQEQSQADVTSTPDAEDPQAQPEPEPEHVDHGDVPPSPAGGGSSLSTGHTRRVGGGGG